MWNRVFVLTVLLCLYSYTTETHGGTLSGPTSQVTFEGKLSIFSCQSDGSVFWLINGELYDPSQVDSFRTKGFSFSDIYLEGLVESSIEVFGSRENNNTVISCVSVSDENEVTTSGNATLTVLGSPSNVELTAVNSSEFKVTWNSSSNPDGFEPDNYTVVVSNNLNTNQEKFVVPVSNETNNYSLEYTVGEELLPLSTCSQFIFSVYSTNLIGDSKAVNVSWENPAATGPIEATQCRLRLNGVGTTTALVTFMFPELCSFQRANYSFSLSVAETNSVPVATSSTRTYTGGQDREIEGQMSGLKLSIENFYRVRVIAELLGASEDMVVSSSTCSGPDVVLKPPDVGGLNNGSAADSQSLPDELTVGIVISALLLLAALILNGTVLLFVCISNRRKTKR